MSGARGDSGADASAQDSAGMDGLKRKTAREGTPKTKKEKSNHCGKERTYIW